LSNKTSGSPTLNHKLLNPKPPTLDPMP
jgi:hypothetical protein